MLTSNQKHSQQEIREERSEVDNFAGPADSLPDAEITENPDQQQGPGELPANVADVLNTAWDLEGSTSVDNKMIINDDICITEKRTPKKRVYMMVSYVKFDVVPSDVCTHYSSIILEELALFIEDFHS